MNNKPVAWINRDEYHGWLNWDKNTEMPINIPLYTQDQLEEARKLGMQQERALWNLSESTQEFENPYKSITNIKIEPTVVSYTHPVKELTNDEMRKVINEIVDGVTVSEMVTFLAISKAILRKAQEK